MRLNSHKKVSLALGFSLVAMAMINASCGFDGHTEEVTSVAFSPDGHYLLTSGHDGTARLWDLKTGAEVRRFLGHDESIHRARFTPDGQYIAACENGGIILWSANNSAESRRISCDCLEVRISPDSKKVAAGQFGSLLKVWDIRSGNEIRSVYIGENGYFSSFAFLPDGKQLMFATDHDDQVALNLLNIDSGEVKQFRLDGERIEQIAPLRDSSLVILGDSKGYLRLWSIVTQQDLNKFKLHQNVNDIYLLPDGDRVLSTSYDEFSLWSIKEGKVLHQFQHDALFTALSPDGRRVASVDSCSNGLSRLLDSMSNIRIWDLETGKTTLTIPYKCPFRVGFH